MAETASWGGHRFVVDAKLIRGFAELSIKGSSETEMVNANGQEYVKRKLGKPVEVQMTAVLNRMTGCKTYEESMKMINQARDGARDFLYQGGGKMVPCQLMLTEAHCQEVVISPKGTWISSKLSLRFQQASQNDGSLYTPPAPPAPPASSASGGGVKTGTANTVNSALTSSKSAKDADKKAKETAKNVVNKAVNTINSIIKDAKKVTPAGGAGGGTRTTTVSIN